MADSAAARTAPERTSASAAASSGASQRSGPGPPTTGARRGQRRTRPGRRGERSPQVEPAGGADQLDGEDPLQVGDGPAQLARRRPPHRHVVLLHGAGGDGVDPGRDGEPPVLGHHRRLRVVGDHHAGVDPGVGRQERRQAVRAGAVEQPVGAPLDQRAEVGDGDGEEVADVGERRAVEVAARLDPAVAQDHRVVDGGHQLVTGDGLGVGDGVARRAVDLGRAAQRVGVLDPGVALAVAGDDGRPGQQPAQVGGADRLPGLRAQGLEVGGEGAVGAEQGLDAHGARQVGHLQQAPEVGQGQHEHAEDAVGPVDQGQALLGPEDDRGQPGRGQRVGGGPQRAVGVAHLTLADEHQRGLGQGRQVTARPERAVLVDDRRQAGVEEGQQPVRHLRPGARAPHGQAAGPQQDHGPDHLPLDLGTHAGGVGADERQLQLGRPLDRDARGGQRAEAGRHAVDGLVGGEEPLDQRRARRHRLPGGRPERRSRATAGHAHDLVRAEPVVGQHDLGVGGHGAAM